MKNFVSNFAKDPKIFSFFFFIFIECLFCNNYNQNIFNHLNIRKPSIFVTRKLFTRNSHTGFIDLNIKFKLQFRGDSS